MTTQSRTIIIEPGAVIPLEDGVDYALQRLPDGRRLVTIMLMGTALPTRSTAELAQIALLNPRQTAA